MAVVLAYVDAVPGRSTRCIDAGGASLAVAIGSWFAVGSTMSSGCVRSTSRSSHCEPRSSQLRLTDLARRGPARRPEQRSPPVRRARAVSARRPGAGVRVRAARRSLRRRGRPGAAVTAERSGLPWAFSIVSPVPLPSRDVPPFGLGLLRHDLVGRMRDRLAKRLTLGTLERLIASREPAASGLGLPIGADDRGRLSGGLRGTRVHGGAVRVPALPDWPAR